MSEQQNPDKSHGRKGKGKVTDPAELERLDQERHLEEVRREELRQLRQLPRPRKGEEDIEEGTGEEDFTFMVNWNDDYEPGAVEKGHNLDVSGTGEEDFASMVHWHDDYEPGVVKKDHNLDASDNPTGPMVDKEGSTTHGETQALVNSLADRRETYVGRAYTLRILIDQEYRSFLSDFHRYYPRTMTRAQMTRRASTLMVSRQYWNEAVDWDLSRRNATDLSEIQERIEAVEQRLMAAGTVALELGNWASVPAPSELLQSNFVMQRFDLEIPDVFLDQEEQQCMREQLQLLLGEQQQHPSRQQQPQQQPRSSRQQQQQKQQRQQQQRSSRQQQQRQRQRQQQQQQQQQQRTLLQRGLDAYGRELFPGSSAGPPVAYFAPPRVRIPEPTAGDRGSTAEEQEQGTGEQDQGPYYRKARSESE